MISEYFLILLATDMSTYLSPIDTTNPPIIAGSTLVVSKIDWPDFKKDFKTPWSLVFCSLSSSLAVITSQTT